MFSLVISFVHNIDDPVCKAYSFLLWIQISLFECLPSPLRKHTTDSSPHYLNHYLWSLIYVNWLCTIFFIIYLPQKLLLTNVANCKAGVLKHFGKQRQNRKYLLFFSVEIRNFLFPLILTEYLTIIHCIDNISTSFIQELFLKTFIEQILFFLLGGEIAIIFYKEKRFRTSLVVQWLRLWVPNAGGPGWIPGQGTRPPGCN